jgi:surface protein
MSAMFQNCSKSTNLNLNNFNTENVNNMNAMFNNCSNLLTLHISNFKTNKVEDMKYIFNNCTKLTTLDLTKFNFSKLNKLDISNFYIVNNMTIIFKKYCKFKTENVIISNENIKYTLISIISEGGFGICYMAKDENNNFYAIKKINIQNKEVVKKEIEILKIMKSKYSVNFLESIEKDDNIYIVMELCDGDLNDLLENKNENLDIITIIKIINQLNEVLKLMHSKKIEHRDLKPENILIKYNYDYLFNYIIVGDMGKILIK